MTIPDYQTLMRPVLQGFGAGAKNVAEIIPALKLEFEISDEEAEELIPSGRVTILSNRAHWARTYLSKAGLLRSPKRNFHEITELGRRSLILHPHRIDNSTLAGSTAFNEWREQASKPKQQDSERINRTEAQPIDDTYNSHTPLERLETAIREIDGALASDVIDAVQSLSPARFEKLVVDLLLAMGYGGGALERGQQTSLSGDGGIDGIINEDELGLDAVYIQAKRYNTENKVGRPALNAFVGSLTGEGASKGVFVTTSDFSKDAMEYVDRVQHRIVLINGDHLARLMIKHEVGVRARKTLVLRSVDEDYFSET